MSKRRTISVSVDSNEIVKNVSINDILDLYSTGEILEHIDLNDVCAYYGEDTILDYLGYPEGTEIPMDCLKKFKELVSPRTYCDKEDLKKLVCDWLDYNMTHAIK